ncbi:hypothetical protein [Bacillus alkalicellulosilyticus]|uniref:hypothetical protein n=1 Tax=Alkalihalobacterium alkalicellulosilyticum TaxID=1912214 RepID=UPI000998DCAC|nr:hypothetical protein [Bacillus alkalicellulosilyticus]
MFILYSALIGLFFLSIFIHSFILDYLVGFMAILAILFSFKDAKKLYQIAGSVFILIALLLFNETGRPWYEMPFLATSTVILIAIFYVLPFINSIIVIGRYDQSVNKLLKTKSTHLGQLYYRASITSFLLGSFLNIATIPLVQQVLKKNLKHLAGKLQHKFISQTMLRGYALCLVWSPMEILVAITIDITGVSYLKLLPWMLLFSVLLLVIDWAIGWRFKKYATDQGQKSEVMIGKRNIRKIIMMLVYLALFISTIIVIRESFELNFLTTVALVIVPYSFLWAFSIRRIKSYTLYSVKMWKTRTANLQNYTVLFLSVGFFISVLRESGHISILQQPLLLLVNNPLLLFVMIQLLFLSLAMVGFHPLVVISILGEILVPVLSILNPLSIGIVLITSSLSTIMAGPYNITVSLTGVLLDENPYQISIWNLGYAFLFSSIGTIMALFLL